ncbi:hypothetical protein MGU_05833 [Metarhizium guizhouense ARSEF 977]|uniref:Uncharacterized protein n=1 Tax=Metarhizium guizhouense (strain ARSEF 977) TaxID=1276136 RepID=A0A0B4GJ41_METGA|nr:hypothetical protein MGU_05833 [Metarhizium guizhouense ARSEF 977]
MCFIWLIDRKAAPQETSGSRKTPCRTFYDMDQDYVESKHSSAEVFEFLPNLEIFLFDWYCGYKEYISDGCFDESDAEWFHVDECVSVLVPVRGK